MNAGQPHTLMQFILPILVAGVIFALRARRMAQMRPLKLERLWIVPVLYFVVVAMIFSQKVPSPVGWVVCVAALAIGAAIGWQRGKTMQIHINPDTHELSQRASIAGIAILFALLVVKMASNSAGSAMHFDVALLTDALAALTLGMFTLTRVEMYLRGKAMLEQARGAR